VRLDLRQFSRHAIGGQRIEGAPIGAFASRAKRESDERCRKLI
jgi:hypothetical protein